MSNKKIRVLISKMGLDGHDRGAKLVAHCLQEAGMDVTFQAIRHTAAEVVDTAVTKKVDYIGLSFLSGDQLTMVPKVIEGLHEKNAGNIRLIVGGVILKEQIPKLEAMGVRRVFLPGTPLNEISEYIKEDATRGAPA